MNSKKLFAFFSLLIILTFVAFIIYDTAKPDLIMEEKVGETNEPKPADQWMVLQEIFINEGLKAVAVSEDGFIIAAGDPFVSCFNSELKKIWSLTAPEKITAVASYGDTVYAASQELIFLISRDGKIISEWGPYEANCLITSITANERYVAIADAGNKTAFILKKNGEVVSMIGHSGEKLLIPSPYFDVYLTSDNVLYLANTGNFRIEKRSIEGLFLLSFGESGTDPDSFCGCCNPAHFTVIPQGFVTAEKGINRIKLIGPEGGFIEFVSSDNEFIPSVPLDVASADGKTIYGANPADSKLYVFTRK